MNDLYGGGQYPLSFCFDRAVESFYALLVEKRTRRVIAQFAYPAETGYSELTKSSNDYSGVITQSETLRIGSEPLVWEIKVDVNGSLIPVGESEEIRGKQTNVAKLPL